jgi:hypothetical protein
MAGEEVQTVAGQPTFSSNQIESNPKALVSNAERV